MVRRRLGVAVWVLMVGLTAAQVTVRLRDTQLTVTEGQQFTVRVQKSGPVNEEVIVVVEISGVDNTTDFIGNSQVGRFEPGGGDDAMTVFTVRDDDMPELEEQYTFTLRVVGGRANVVPPNTATVTIVASDDAFGRFSFTGAYRVYVNEELTVGTQELEIRRDRGTFGNVNLQFQVEGDTDSAVPGGDLSPATGAVEFVEGQTQARLTFQVLPDQVPEDEEIFTVSLSSTNAGVTFDVGQIQIAVRANDAPIRFAQAEIHVEEGNSSNIIEVMVYRGLMADGVTLIGPSDTVATISYQLISGSAVYGQDFRGANGSVGFPVNSTKQPITIQILDDDISETEESFQVVLSNPSDDVVISDPSTLSIVIVSSDDAFGVLHLGNRGQPMATLYVNEDTDNLVNVTIHRSEGALGEVSVEWEITRVNDDLDIDPVTSDLGPSQGMVVLGLGVREQTVVLSVLQDRVPEPAEGFVFRLIPGNVTGGARLEVPTSMNMVIRDSDAAYGVIELAPASTQRLITSTVPRLLELTIDRTGGTLGDVNVTFSIQYLQSLDITDILGESNPLALTLYEGETRTGINLTVNPAAFLVVGANFDVEILNATLNTEPSMGAFNSPVIGARKQIAVLVTAEAANGEIGFLHTQPIRIQESEVFTQAVLQISREGTNGRALIYWEAVGVNVNGSSVTDTDIQESSGSVTMETGMSLSEITITVLPDDEPETEETIRVTLSRVEPADTQRLRAGAATVDIIIAENDNPGGTFQFSPAMSHLYTAEEEGSPVNIIVVRSGGALLTRRVEYFIEPNGGVEFYGSENVLVFEPGVMTMNASVVARGDGIPELTELFTLRLRSYGETQATVFGRTAVSITVPPNDDPYGVIHFADNPAVSYINESKAGAEQSAQIAVQRSRGTFDSVTVDWTLEGDSLTSPDFSTQSGSVTFGPGQTRGYVLLKSQPDEIPEPLESFTVRLSLSQSSVKLPKLGDPQTATININENDHQVYFSGARQLDANEPSQVTLTLVRDGNPNFEAQVRYRTVDGTAREQDGDFKGVFFGTATFGLGQSETNITIYILDDTLPESDEEFGVELFDPRGDIVVSSQGNISVVILANDDAGGVFEFRTPQTKQAAEGTPASFVVIRDRGDFGSMNVFWELVDNTSLAQGSADDDFVESSGFVTFTTGQTQVSISLMARVDGIPELTETFLLTLVNVTAGENEEQFGRLGNPDRLTAHVVVVANDDPNGLFGFHPTLRNVTVAEDYLPGDYASTLGELVVMREQGTYGHVEVLWELSLLEADDVYVWDLLFLGDIPSQVQAAPDKQRPRTGTMPYFFNGGQDAFVTVPTKEQPLQTDLADGFSISLWLIPYSDNNGYILSKNSADGSVVHYGLKLRSSATSTTLEFRYSGAGKINHVVAVSSTDNIQDGLWHYVVVSVQPGLASFYLDGNFIDNRTLETGSLLDEAGGPLLVGTPASGTDRYVGHLQDVQLIPTLLTLSQVEQRYNQTSLTDVTPISGIVRFEEGLREGTVSVRSVDDDQPEPQGETTLRLVSVKGGGRISRNDSMATVTVLKSDNANGLFGFGGDCNSVGSSPEARVISCPVVRMLGDSGSVTVTWVVVRQGQPITNILTGDFVNTTGTLVFEDGERSGILNLVVADDLDPELEESYEVALTSAIPDDGHKSSTPTSGASVNTTRVTVVIEENDNPYGLLQFSSSTSPPGVGDPVIPPATEQPEVHVAEEAGTVSLLVVRAQGLVGRVSVEWRGQDGTATSSQPSPDYQVPAAGGRLDFEEFQRFAYINIQINDNNIPEDDKIFYVELVNPTGGAAVGVASRVKVVIDYSDGAYGVFQFAEDSLGVSAQEVGDVGFNTITLEVLRLSGTIGETTLWWEVSGDSHNDLVSTRGTLDFAEGQAANQLLLQIRSDTEPELDHQITIAIFNVSKGELGPVDKLSATVTIEANDNPYGVFTIPSSNRPLTVSEEFRNVTVSVRRLFGTMGVVDVDFQTLTPSETFAFISPASARANYSDFTPTSGTLRFLAGQIFSSFVVGILDDDVPEEAESVYVRLTGVRLVQGEQPRPVPSSPRLEQSSLTFAQIVILSNDNANGILELSPLSVTIYENHTGPVVNVLRRGGLFGEIVVNYKITDGTTVRGQDYSELSTDVVLSEGESSKPLLVDIKDDDIPELAEYFSIELLAGTAGGAVLGENTIARVTIAPSDDPSGVFSFSSGGLSVSEPADSQPRQVNVSIVRSGGTMGVVSVAWEASLNNSSPVSDITPVSGTRIFVSNEAHMDFTISVLPDDFPEEQEDIRIRLMSVTEGARIGDISVFTLSILPNDNPHGLVTFSQPSFTLEEGPQDTTQYLSLSRVGGTFGQLRVYYQTGNIDILAEANKNGSNVYSYYRVAKLGRSPLPATVANITGQPQPVERCAEVCLLSPSCAAFQFTSSSQRCETFLIADTDDLLSSSDTQYYAKNMPKARFLYGTSSTSGEDYRSISGEPIIIPAGAVTASIPLTILADNTPELNEKFIVTLTRIELVGRTPVNEDDTPKFGALRSAEVVIPANDNAQGVFSIYSANPSAEGGGSLIVVPEQGRLSVDLVIDRQGGSIGEVTVSWAVNLTASSASPGVDFRADGAQLRFLDGDERTRAITVSILEDDLPEDDETIVVELIEPGGGATLSVNRSVTVVIQANDNVAGVLGVNPLTLVTDEGETINLTVTRTSPGLGEVIVTWEIQGVDGSIPNTNLDKYRGTLTFAQGELSKTIRVEVLRDQLPELNEEYEFKLTSVTTQGVRDTGGASIHPQQGTASITIRGSDDPHGVISFSSTSLSVRAHEGETNLQLFVDRKFGSSGTVRVEFVAWAGYLFVPGPRLDVATPVDDFTPEGRYVYLEDGQNTGAITLRIINDLLPEIDEAFLVNLTSVRLVGAVDNLPPKLADSNVVAQVTITANDGAQGTLEFAPNSTRSSVTEENTTLTLLVLRTGGTFGNVSVRYFSQSQTNSVSQDSDFILNSQILHFAHGVSSQTISIEILEDTVPEPDEEFLVVLDSPLGGATLGEQAQASVTILANDDAGGFVSFDLRDNITLTEPRGVNLADSIANFRLVRGPGIYGVVNVPFAVETAGGGDTTDLTPVTGYVTFQDRQLSAVLEIRAVEDDLPEVIEQFKVRLLAPIGGAQLGEITERTILIRESDAPYGLLQIYPSGTRSSFWDVEESVGLLNFDVVRSQGLQGTVTVEVLTQSGTAAVSGNSTSFTMATVQTFPSLHAHIWYGFHFHGDTFSLQLTTVTGDLSSPVIGGPLRPGIGRSVLYEWREGFTPVQVLETNGASGATSFEQGGITYVVITNRGSEQRRETPSRVYRMNDNGTLSLVQELSSVGAEDCAFFSQNGQSFLVIANGQSSLGLTTIDSPVYEWDRGRSLFNTSPWQLIGGRGVKAVDVFTIGSDLFLALANYYDSTTQQYEIESVILKLQPNNKFALYQYLTTQGAMDVKHVLIGGELFLVIANGMLDDSSKVNLTSVVYKWDRAGLSFQWFQDLPTRKPHSIETFTGPDQKVYVMIADTVANSTVFVWDTAQLKFVAVWEARPASHISTVTVNHPSELAVLLTLSNPEDTNPASTLYQVTLVKDSDFIPRKTTLTFLQGETIKQMSVVVLEDDIPEDTETFYVALSNPGGGAEIGSNQKTAVNILSNDDAHGVIEFSEDSMDRRESEIPRQDNPVHLTVRRYRGDYGRVVVRWRMTGDQGLQDITPQAGLVEFAPGQSIAIISLVIKDDLTPELAELSMVSLETVVEPGTVLSDRGATLGRRRVSRLTVLASDSPHGVVYWASPRVEVREPEGTDATVLLSIVRDQGSLGDISVSYRTSQAQSYRLEEQAASGQDYVATQGSIIVKDGQTDATVAIQLLRDDLPELGEVFLVNLTGVSLVTGSAATGAGPSVRDPGNSVTVTILENDNARGLVLFDVDTNTEGRVDTYEAFGQNRTLSLRVRRVVGYFGAVLVQWQVYHRQTTVADLTPSAGTLRFGPGVREAYIYITVLDDTLFEPMEQFDVKLIGVSEGARLGAITSVRVAILKNDSPRGLFGFDRTEVSVSEARLPGDVNGEVTLRVTRRVGTEGVVPVQWRLNAEAQNDFEPPRSGLLTFQPGEAQKSLTLTTRVDDILEGEERFIVSLVSAEDADISSDNGDVTVIISPDPGSSGTVSILPAYRRVYIGEPGESSPVYRGQTEVMLTRGAGIFSAITVTWSVTPRDVTAFAQLEGTVEFATLQETASITLQARDDTRPELRALFSLQLTSATGGAVISTDTGSAVSEIVFVASDYPHGLFQFAPPAVTPVQEDEGFVEVAVAREYGRVGRVQLTFVTSDGTATANQDYVPRSGVLMFEDGETTKTVRVDITQDSVPEGPENFYINITGVKLLVPSDNDYSDVGGLKVDMRPGLGPTIVKTVRIDKSDDAEGVLQFDSTALQTSVREEDGTARLTVTRMGGSYGRVSVAYRAENLTATAGVDYALQPGEAIFEDGMTKNTINVTLFDDLEREAAETFRIILTSTSGGAQLGSPTTASVTIQRSDFPNGLFEFAGSTSVLLANPSAEVTQTLRIRRAGGLVGQQTVSWRILGPNDPTAVLQNTGDIAYRVNNMDVTLGTLRWGDGEGGEKTLTLYVKPHSGWEIQKVFVVEIYDIVGAPGGVGNGETDSRSSKTTITIQKFGHPNGIVEFGEVAQTPRLVDEPVASTFTLRFPIKRQVDTGVVGNVMVYWEVAGGAEEDILPVSGSVALENGVRTGEVIIQVLPDDVPELTETYILRLVRVEGGAEISQAHNSSVFSVRYNDNPHGVFGVDTVYQTVIVDPLTNQRRLRLNISREAGTFGSVQVFYSIKYDQPQQQSGIGVERSSGSVTFQDGEESAITMVTVVGDGFLETDSTFSLSLVSAPVYQGSDVTQPPSLKAGQTEAKVIVPETAANAEVGFLDDTLIVNEMTSQVDVTLTRRGLYGSLNVRVSAGFPTGQLPVGFQQGEVTPDLRTVTIPQGQKAKTVSFQLVGKREVKELFAFHLPQKPTSGQVGGARLWAGKTVTQVDPSGVLGFAPDSREVVGSELAGEVTLMVERLYGSQDRIEALLEVRGGNASSTTDFRLKRSTITMDVGQLTAPVVIEVLQDSYPERVEDFTLVLTEVEKFPTVTTAELSPRISALYDSSHVVIRESNDPYGLLSVDSVGGIEEKDQDITITVRRTGGTYGSVSVVVRSVGGNEVWSSEIAVQKTTDTQTDGPHTIGQALGDSTVTPAIGGRDYEIIDTTVYFADGESVKTVVLTILDDDEAEPTETLYVYLTQPLGGARIATGAPDRGLRGYTAVEILANDYSNGLVGFTDLSLYVSVDEDVPSPAVPLQLQRRNAFYGELQVFWRAKWRLTSELKEDDLLRGQLADITGVVNCPAGKEICPLSIPLIDDQTPEEAVGFLIILERVGSDAVLDNTRRVANVTVRASDYVRGLIQFVPDYSIVHVDKDTRSVRLEVVRRFGSGYPVEVNYSTIQLPAPVTVSGVEIFPALPGEDYITSTGKLTFPPNSQELQYINVTLTPLMSRSNDYPKQLYVRLSNPTNGASINNNHRQSVVRIVDQSELPIWEAIKMIPVNNENIVQVLEELERTVTGDMGDNQGVLVEDVLRAITDKGLGETFPVDVLKPRLFDIFCNLLDLRKSDSRRGRHSYSKLLENFAYGLVTGKACPYPIPPQLVTYQCQNVKVSAGRWGLDNVTGFTYSAQFEDNFVVPTRVNGMPVNNIQECVDLHLIEYNSEQWFYEEGQTQPQLLNNRIVSFGLKGRDSSYSDVPATYRIHTPRRAIAPRRSQCVYFEESSGRWTADLCQVTNEFALDVDDFVDCSCNHLTSYAVKARVTPTTGYLVWFYVACFICIIGLALTIISHHVFSILPRFSVCLLMHMCFACLATQICYVIAAFFSPTDILVTSLDQDNGRCIAMGLFLHYFFLAQFTWILTQAVNFWKILVMNDEHTDRKYAAFFLVGWASPAVIVAIFYIIAYNVYKYVYDMPYNFIYGDVGNAGEICFVTNALAAMGGVILPAILLLLAACVVFIQAYQLTPQWKAYDDIYKGRHNYHEVRILLCFWLLITLTWVWGGLHLAYRHLWMLILFCIFNIAQGLYALVVYTILRNPYLPCTRPQKASYSLGGGPVGGATLPYSSTLPPSMKGSRASLINENWERESVTPSAQMKVRRTLPSHTNIYVTPPVLLRQPHDPDRQDFDDLLFALKTGSPITHSDISKSPDTLSVTSSKAGNYEMKRVSITDTHL